MSLLAFGKIHGISRALKCPPDDHWVLLTLKLADLIVHCLASKLSIIPVGIADVCTASSAPHGSLVDLNVLYFTPGWEHFVEVWCCILEAVLWAIGGSYLVLLNCKPGRSLAVDIAVLGCRLGNFEGHTCYVYRAALNVEGPNARHVVFVGWVAGAAKDVLGVVILEENILVSWNSMQIRAISSLGTVPSGKINTKPTVFKRFSTLISLCVASILLWIAFVLCSMPLLPFMAICEVLVIPDIVVITPFNVGSIL